MAEPKLATIDGQIIERWLPDPGPDATEHQRKTLAFLRGKGAQIAKDVRADERTKRQPEIDAARTSAHEAATKAFDAALLEMRADAAEKAHHKAQAAAGRWFGIASMIWLVVCVAIAFGVSIYTAETQMNTVAAMRAVNAPRGLQGSPEMRPQEGGGFQ